MVISSFKGSWNIFQLGALPLLSKCRILLLMKKWTLGIKRSLAISDAHRSQKREFLPLWCLHVVGELDIHQAIMKITAKLHTASEVKKNFIGF